MSSETQQWADQYDLLVLEGCDGAGKTTLARQLEVEHRFTVVHADESPAGTDVYRRYRTLLAMPGRFVWDRSFISEVVYGEVFRTASRITYAQLVDLAIEVARAHGAFVHVQAAPSIIYERLRTRGSSDMWEIERIATIQTAYDAAFAQIEPYAPVVTFHTD